MRTISADTLRELLAEESGDTILWIVEIDHPDMTAPAYLVNDMVDLDYGGNTYVAFPFEPRLAEDAEDGVPEAQIRIANIDRSLVDEIRSISSPPTITATIGRKRADDGVFVPEIGPTELRMNQVGYNALWISASLGQDADYVNEPAAQHRFDPVVAPGLFS